MDYALSNLSRKVVMDITEKYSQKNYKEIDIGDASP